jgi:hypothetical protein
MLGCSTRGYSFTRALLGIAADELHLCGDPAAVPLIQEILDITGDEVEVMKLMFSVQSLNNLKTHSLFFRGWGMGQINALNYWLQTCCNFILINWPLW